MIAPLRNRHRTMVLLLAALLPVPVALALVTRPTMPVERDTWERLSPGEDALDTPDTILLTESNEFAVFPWVNFGFFHDRFWSCL